MGWKAVVFFKQMTAYEVRISDWSSDVCSSDLRRLTLPERRGGSPLVLAHCWSHARREIIKATPQNGSPVADEVLRRIAHLYGIEKEIRGRPAAERLAVRQQRSRPLVEIGRAHV